MLFVENETGFLEPGVTSRGQVFITRLTYKVRLLHYYISAVLVIESFGTTFNNVT